MDYSARLSCLCLHSLEGRRLTTDLILTYRIVFGLIEVNMADYCDTFAEIDPYCHSILSVCLSGCLSVILRPTAYHNWSITTKFGRQVYTCPRTRVSLCGSPISHTFEVLVPEGKICNTYSCHCKRDASCHMTCFLLQSIKVDHITTRGNPYKLFVNYCRTNTRKKLVSHHIEKFGTVCRQLLLIFPHWHHSKAP